MSTQSYIFIGKSGCGKGTQGKLLADFLKTKDTSRDIFYVQSGDEFRRFIQGDSYTKHLSKKIYDDGKLEPEFLAILMWANYFAENYNGKDHIVIDGTPREVHEAGVLHSIFDFYKLEKPRVVYINISAEEATRRLSGRGRRDDNEVDIKARLKWFETDVIPTIDFYRSNPFYQFVEVNGERDTEVVHQEILQRVGLI
ncbi:MAG: nucleoside monophosphate kinase [bacterium]|nr:nucleoside monophosphate kinase [bacterium]